MSSLALRQAVRAAWPTLMPGVRYIDTVNRSLPQNPPLPLPDIWGTLAFDTTIRRILTMGENPWVEEQGTVNIVIVGKSGHGDNPTVAAGDQAMNAWFGWTALGGDLWFQNVSAPKELDPQADGNWYLVTVTCDYRLQGREQLP